jgi:hypothetical protein
MRTLYLVIAATFAVSACSTTVQDTSGSDYLSRYRDPAARANTAPHAPPSAKTGSEVAPVGVTGEEAFHRAAAVEPLIEFPARIGLARIYKGQMTAIPAKEAEHWQAFREKNAHLGDFVPISPAIAEFTTQAVSNQRTEYARGAGEVMTRIRLGAARQHVDAVLIY